MSFSEQHGLIIKQPFNYDNNAHRTLLEEKLAVFTTQHQAISNTAPKILTALVATVISRVTGFTSFMYIPIDLTIFGYAVWQIAKNVHLNYAYQEALKDILQIYDWLLPQEQALNAMPLPIDKVPVQSLIETLGTLINPERLLRLERLTKAEQSAPSWQNTMTASAWSYFSKSQVGQFFNLSPSSSPEQELTPIEKPVFIAMLRALLNHQTTSSFNYWLYGEGTQKWNWALQKISNTPIPNGLTPTDLVSLAATLNSTRQSHVQDAKHK